MANRPRVLHKTHGRPHYALHARMEDGKLMIARFHVPENTVAAATAHAHLLIKKREARDNTRAVGAVLLNTRNTAHQPLRLDLENR